ncbi:unnamed protein product [Pylaiella littoralis]
MASLATGSPGGGIPPLLASVARKVSAAAVSAGRSGGGGSGGGRGSKADAARAASDGFDPGSSAQGKGRGAPGEETERRRRRKTSTGERGRGSVGGGREKPERSPSRSSIKEAREEEDGGDGVGSDSAEIGDNLGCSGGGIVEVLRPGATSVAAVSDQPPSTGTIASAKSS